MKKLQYEYHIGACSQGGYINIWAEREDVYPKGAHLLIDNGDMEGQCGIYLSTDDLRLVARHLYQIARSIERERRADKR